ncbi:MAG: bifunctional serine/threonine-protein kinase/formylglycine-generating enzyme family protein [Planctomycetota bacterium]
MSSFEAYARALALVERYRAARQQGAAPPPEDFVAAHPDVADILRDLLATEEHAAATRADGPSPGTAWRGLPGDGQAIGGYRVERLLGQGGMGVVFLAEDVRLRRKAALKLIRPERLGSPAALERFWREAKLAARLEHPNICPVYEVGEEGGMPFMAMRFLDGETLAARIAREPPASATTSRAAVDALLETIETVARALHFAHAQGVVHRDVKPANILIEPDGNPIVLDFGMALAADDDLGLTMTGELAGTPLYMAPEQVTPNARGVDHRADVYALGVTMYEAATGVRPFGGQSMRELLDAIAKQTAPPASRSNRALPPDLDVVLEKALEKDLDRRYRTAADLADDLRRVRAREPVLARRAGRLLRTRRWVQRNPYVVAVMALVAAALVVISLLYVNGEETRKDFELVSFVRRLDELQAAEAPIYRAWPEYGPALRVWLQRADDLRAEVEAVRPALARLGTAGPEGPTPPADPARRFLFETLRSVVGQADALTQPGGAITRVRRNLDQLERERAATAAAADAWRDAVAAIAASPLYGGMQLAVQEGLVPLGPNPANGLWEFGHPRSGSMPERGPTGHFFVDDDTCIVFALLPGGTFVMGAQSKSEDAPNYDPMARISESPPHDVTLAPFFLAEHELTQGQWMRLTGGGNPAEARPGSNFKVRLSLAHPVEMVSWNACSRVLTQAGLTMPTEAQWEYGARGGTHTPWWTGTDVAALVAGANVADETALAAGAEWFELVALETLAATAREHFSDGYVWHAEVDALEPNAFGLYGTAGNVWEWCRDTYASYRHPCGEGDGLRDDGDGQKVLRGGAFDHAPMHARAALRRQDDPATRSGNLGVRAARALR